MPGLPQGDEEHTLVERLRSGDEAAFQALVDRYDGAMRRVARSFVKTQAAADDVVQDAWLGVIKGLPAFEERSSLRTWIFRIVANQARTRAVRDARSLPFSSIESDDGPAVDPSSFGADGMWSSSPPRLDADPASALLSTELRAELGDAIEMLPDAQRAVITLRDVVGLEPHEVSELLDITDGNQRVLLHRARSKVRAALVPDTEVQL